MNASVRLLLRVFLPLVCQPHGDTGCGLPCPERPSPPPCGWSTGFIATPRTVGRMPRQPLAPALHGPNRHRIAGPERRVGAGLQLVTRGHALRGEDVATLAVLVEQQRDVRRPVRVVFEMLDLRGDIVLVAGG